MSQEDHRGVTLGFRSVPRYCCNDRNASSAPLLIELLDTCDLCPKMWLGRSRTEWWVFLIGPMQNTPCGKWQNIECWVQSGKWRWGFCPYSREVLKGGLTTQIAPPPSPTTKWDCRLTTETFQICRERASLPALSAWTKLMHSTLFFSTRDRFCLKFKFTESKIHWPME